jgi:hypothetical protein
MVVYVVETGWIESYCMALEIVSRGLRIGNVDKFVKYAGMMDSVSAFEPSKNTEFGITSKEH